MTVQQNTLTISGERHKKTPERVVWHRRERGTGKFLWIVELPLDEDSDEVRAEYKDGLLKVTPPKAEAKPTGWRSKHPEVKRDNS
ncbi:MAG: Hsp20/alpha crystallin family protein [Syntrophotaleaceae bacterium]